MPIFEYLCLTCSKQFELWLRKPGEQPACSTCGSDALERLISLPRIHSKGRRQRSMRSAKRRDSSQAKEMAHAQREYELAHDD